MRQDNSQEETSEELTDKHETGYGATLISKSNTKSKSNTTTNNNKY